MRVAGGEGREGRRAIWRVGRARWCRAGGVGPGGIGLGGIGLDGVGHGWRLRDAIRRRGGCARWVGCCVPVGRGGRSGRGPLVRRPSDGPPCLRRFVRRANPRAPACPGQAQFRANPRLAHADYQPTVPAEPPSASALTRSGRRPARRSASLLPVRRGLSSHRRRRTEVGLRSWAGGRGARGRGSCGARGG